MVKIITSKYLIVTGMQPLKSMIPFDSEISHVTGCTNIMINDYPLHRSLVDI